MFGGQLFGYTTMAGTGGIGARFPVFIGGNTSNVWSKFCIKCTI